MVPTSQTGISTPNALDCSSVPTETIPALIHRLEIDTFTSFPRVGNRSGGPVTGPSILRVSSSWEVALIAVLFLLISGLIVLRLAELMSDRDIDMSSFSLETENATETDELESTSTVDHRSYEHYLSPETPSELLSDEGEVVRLLVANHGRIRQHQIAEETGWSKSKVSRICSQMHADGTIEKTSVGRENVITLSDQKPTVDSESDDVENPLP